jgi:DUF4097 and DUF4098 domain-containing protein YvlB
VTIFIMRAFVPSSCRGRILAATLCSTLFWASQALAQSSSRRPDTDETVQAVRGSQLFVNNFAGEVVVRGWNRDEVRVTAQHGSRVKISVRPSENGVRVSSSSSSGTPSVDYDISVPAWMPIRITGQFNYVQVEGTQADVSAETVRGDIRVKGGSGIITLKSIEGEVHVEEAKGRISVSSVNEGITVTRSSGEINAETINGEIAITDAKASGAEATTVNGDVRYSGTIADNGLYRFNTHNGDILMGVPERLNATVSVRTYQVDFESTFPVNAGEVRRGRRQTFTLGSGSAQIELESFGGEIQLRRLNEMPPPRERRDERDDEASLQLRDPSEAGPGFGRSPSL